MSSHDVIDLYEGWSRLLTGNLNRSGHDLNHTPHMFRMFFSIKTAPTIGGRKLRKTGEVVGHFLQIKDFEKPELLDIIELARLIKYSYRHGAHPMLLKGSSLGILREKVEIGRASCRGRVASPA